MKDVEKAVIYCETEAQFDKAIEKLKDVLTDSFTWLSGDGIDEYSPYSMLWEDDSVCISLTQLDDSEICMSFQYGETVKEPSESFENQINNYIETVVQFKI